MIWIGRFKETFGNDSYPSIFEAVRKEAPENKGKILAYLKRGKVEAVSPGYLVDVFDDSKQIRYLACLSDGVYAWRSDMTYYYEHYNIELPEEFIQHVLEKPIRLWDRPSAQEEYLEK